MPRCQRCRRVCEMPKHYLFNNAEHTDDTVNLTIDEFETLRLVDYLKLTHAECSKRMNVSRTTVTEIYELARFKVSQMLVEGKNISISGGNYHLCSGQKIELCCDNNCHKKTNNILEKGEKIMRVAVAYDEGEVFQHFGHTESFKIYDIDDGRVKNAQIIPSNGEGHGALAILLSQNKVDVLICGGIGGGAINALSAAKITVYAGVSGSADEAINSFISGTLSKNSSANCNHNDNHEYGDNGCNHNNHADHKCNCKE